MPVEQICAALMKHVFSGSMYSKKKKSAPTKLVKRLFSTRCSTKLHGSNWANSRIILTAVRVITWTLFKNQENVVKYIQAKSCGAKAAVTITQYPTLKKWKARQPSLGSNQRKYSTVYEKNQRRDVTIVKLWNWTVLTSFVCFIFILRSREATVALYLERILTI